MDNALSNSLILEAIILYVCSPPYLYIYSPIRVKDLRLVSSAWNEAILGLPHPKLCLSVNKFNKISQELDDPFSNINPKSARAIHFQYRSNLPSTSGYIRNFCNYFSANIQGMSVHCGTGVVPLLHEVLSEFVPNLKHLSILIHNNLGNDWPDALDSKAAIPTKSKLQTLSISGDDDRDDISNEPMQTFLQLVVSSSPNLKELNIQESFCPVLPDNCHLKILKFDWNYAAPLFSLAPTPLKCLKFLTNILNQARNTLERLELNCSVFEPYNLNGKITGFKFPERMPKLKYLKNYRMDVFQGGCEMEYWRNTRMPNLTMLELRNEDYPNLPRLIESGLVPVSRIDRLFSSLAGTAGLACLKLIGIKDISFLRKLSTPFPNLKTLHIAIADRPMVDGLESEIILKNIVAALKNMKVKHLNITAPFPLSFSNFMDCLHLLATSFTGLETLELSHIGIDINIWALLEGRHYKMSQYEIPGTLEVFYTVLLEMKVFKLVTISKCRFEPGIRDWSKKIISKYKLPVTFKD